MSWLTCHRAQNQASPQAHEGQQQLQRALGQPRVPRHELHTTELLLAGQALSVRVDSGPGICKSLLQLL